MEFSRQEYWSRLPFLSTGDLPDTGSEPRSTRMLRLEKIDNIKCWKGCGATGTLPHCCWNVKHITTLENSFSVSCKCKHKFPYKSGLGVYSKEVKIYAHKESVNYVQTALFVIAPRWKKPSIHLRTDEWTNNMWNIQRSYSVI